MVVGSSTKPGQGVTEFLYTIVEEGVIADGCKVCLPRFVSHQDWKKCEKEWADHFGMVKHVSPDQCPLYAAGVNMADRSLNEDHLRQLTQTAKGRPSQLPYCQFVLHPMELLKKKKGVTETVDRPCIPCPCHPCPCHSCRPCVVMQEKKGGQQEKKKQTKEKRGGKKKAVTSTVGEVSSMSPMLCMSPMSPMPCMSSKSLTHLLSCRGRRMSKSSSSSRRKIRRRRSWRIRRSRKRGGRRRLSLRRSVKFLPCHPCHPCH